MRMWEKKEEIEQYNKAMYGKSAERFGNAGYNDAGIILSVDWFWWQYWPEFIYLLQPVD